MAKESFVEWWKRQRSDRLQEIELMEAGQLKTTEDRGSERVDTTDETIAKSKKFVAELDAWIAKSNPKG
jgi:hypothetical protein